MKSPLRDYQDRAVKYAIKNAYCILGLDPGLGKSRIAIEAHEIKGGNCLIVCPSYLIQNWVDEIRKWAPPERIVTTFKRGKDIYDVFDTDYAIVSYELAQRSEWLFEWADQVTIDEAHNMKNMKAKRTTYLHKNIYENSVKRLLLLTGTPIKNRVEEFYSLLAVCYYNPRAPDGRFLDQFPSSIDFADYFSFREEYTIEIGHRFVTIVKWRGLRNVEELKGFLKGHYIRIKSSDVLDLPPIVYKDFMISQLPDEDLKLAFDRHFNEDGSGDVNPTAKAMAALKKAPITVKYAKDLIEEAGCVLIYSDHIEASEEIAKAFNVTALNSRVPSHKRMEAAKEFQEGKGTVLVATIQSLSMGVNLTRANHIILNDYPWVPGDLKQTIYRIQRLGQEKSCFVHRMIGSPQDKYIMETIEEKMETIEKAT